MPTSASRRGIKKNGRKQSYSILRVKFSRTLFPPAVVIDDFPDSVNIDCCIFIYLFIRVLYTRPCCNNIEDERFITAAL